MSALLQVTDTGAPLNSARAFRYLWLNWRLIGMHPTRRHRCLYFAYSASINSVFGILLPATMIAKLCFIENLPQLIGLLYLGVTLTMATAKQFSLWLHRSKLLDVNLYLAKLDARCNHHAVDRQHLLSAIRICHFYYVAYMFVYELSSSGFAYIGFSLRQLVYDAWFPKLYDDADKNLTITLIYQNFAVMTFFVLQNVNNDMYPQCYLAVMIGHMRALSARISRVGKDDALSVEDNIEELKNCIEDHKNLLSYFACIRPVISRTIFMQFGITAFVLCLTAVKYVAFGADTAQMLIAITYIFAVLIEALPCCWYVNALLEECGQLTLAIYSCQWFEQSKEFRKILIVFMQRSQRATVLMAGNLVPITLQTFLNVVTPLRVV
ncbi:odorant receptor 7a-like [Rhagoletis pomonella]|uniref:odorant receptor 7a-like n=1 Tax=Rhagoletis pomonella TaxID=28610 RepID=UPI0017852910|nr:odorant receptor 7a-like [Rhagoletis pomonella]